MGKIGEEQAISYLIEHGYKIKEQNFFCRNGEIDIIAAEEGYLVFIEVKYRTSENTGLPEEAITISKQRKIIKAARCYLYQKGLLEETPCRFDVVTILKDHITILKNAFDIN